MKPNSGFVKVHQPCPCGEGDDNTGVNADGSAYCFACSKYFKNYTKEDSAIENNNKNNNLQQSMNTLSLSKFRDIPDRKLTEDTCKFFGVKVEENASGITKHHYPYYDEEGNQVSTKIRRCVDKEFNITGNHKASSLFGRNKFKAGSAKFITICEGELDAMSAFQMTGSKWPCLSIKNGSGSAEKDIKKDLEYLESFSNIVICMDMDKAGQAVVKNMARLLTPGKVKIMSLPEGFKDPSEMLVANKSADFVQAFWNAEKYIPSGIINASTFREQFMKREVHQSVPYPYEGLNRKLMGLQLKSLVTFTGGSGLGKSSVTRELESHLLNVTDANVGVLALEEDIQRTIMGVVSIAANEKLFIDEIRKDFPDEKLNDLYVELFENKFKDRFYVHAHLGIQDLEDIFAKLRYLIIGCDCKYIVLDHLHMLVHAANTTDNDERRTIDEIMLRLRSLVEETGCCMILVSHLRRTQNDRGHEEGTEVSLSHLRGSQSIAQLSDTVIALERNQQAEDKRKANTSVLRVLKSRHTGDTGIACTLEYDSQTGRLNETEPDLEFTIQD